MMSSSTNFGGRTRASPRAASLGARASPARAIGSAQKRRLLARMMMLSHKTAGQPYDSSTGFDQDGCDIDGEKQVGDERFTSGHSIGSGSGVGSGVGSGMGRGIGSGEVKMGWFDESTLGVMNRWRDEEVRDIEKIEEEEVAVDNDNGRGDGDGDDYLGDDDNGDGWYEEAMEIIRQDALIQEQVLAATLL